ncbi:MAG TPA: carboxypeptidase-like regulatory domain-containing protein [Planctomycetota bacterium]|nr:carboxypeptidase-like regulatory domain-containing protein [Planctomycetota bacterium]
MKKGLLLLVAIALAVVGLYRWSATSSTTASDRVEVLASREVHEAAQPNPEVPLSSPRVAMEVEKQAATFSSPPSLTIQVVDSAGIPLAGVPVAIRERDAPAGEPDLERVVTQGSEGCARFEGLSKDAQRRGVFAHLEVFGCESVGELAVPSDYAAGPVRLTLPPFGSIAVRVHDADGGFLPVSLVELESLDLSTRPAHQFRPTSTATDRVVFDFVTLGCSLRVRAAERWQQGEASGTGPATAGERVEFDIDLGRPELRLVARLVDEEMRALANCSFESSQYSRFQYFIGGGSETRSTDADGRFRMLLPRCKVSLWLRPTCSECRECPGERFQVDGNVEARELDLGDIVVRSKRELASGRVLDDLGAPVSFAAVIGRTADGAAEDPNLSESAVHGDCTADGTFTVSGPRPSGQMRLRASRRGYVDAESAWIVPGATNVWITMTRMGRIEGSLLLDDIGSSTRLWVHATPRRQSQDPNAIPLELTQGLVDHDGTFVVPNVTPGVCDLAIYTEGGQSPLLTLEGITLLPGEAATDLRLAAIDLRGKVPAPVPLPAKQD